MNRSKAGARLSAYLEGDLSESERSKLESHLADDPELRETLRELEGVVSALRGLPEPELPPAFSTRVIARVQEQREQGPAGALDWLRRIFEPAVAVPMAAGITALALVIGSQEGIDAAPPGAPAVAPQVAFADPPAPAPAPERLRSRPDAAALAGTKLASNAPTDERELTLTDIQRRTLQTILSRHPHEDLARLLRGSGHPHAASFASQVVETDPNLQLVSHESRLRARR